MKAYPDMDFWGFGTPVKHSHRETVMKLSGGFTKYTQREQWQLIQEVTKEPRITCMELQVSVKVKSSWLNNQKQTWQKCHHGISYRARNHKQDTKKHPDDPQDLFEKTRDEAHPLHCQCWRTPGYWFTRLSWIGQTLHWQPLDHRIHLCQGQNSANRPMKIDISWWLSNKVTVFKH